LTQLTSPATSRWIDQVPSLLAPLAQRDGIHTFKARLDDGTNVAVRRIAMADPAAGARMVEHLRRVGDLSDPYLVPIRGAQFDGHHLWVISELDDGAPLSRLLDLFKLSPAQAAAIGIAILGGVAALQRSGLSHGALSANNVLVARDGRVRLANYALKPRLRPGSATIGWPDPKADLVNAGALLLSALDIQSDGPGGRVDNSVPALAVIARALASGSMGRDAAAAMAMVKDAAGELASRNRENRSYRELGILADSARSAVASAVTTAIGSVRSATPEPAAARVAPAAVTAPALRPEPPPAPAVAPVRSRAAEPEGRPSPRRRFAAWPLVAGLAGLLLLLAIGVPAAGRLAASRTQGRALAPSARATAPAAAPSQAPAAAPSQAPQDSAAGAPTVDNGGAAAPAPADGAPQPAAPASGGADSPTTAVAGFYQAVAQHQFDAAAAYWSGRMQANWPPSVYIDQRFTPTQSMTLQGANVVSQGDGTAVVSIDLVEVYNGSTRHWVGSWQLVRGSGGWVLDAPNLHQA
jgi:hypothetical protein